MTEVTKRTTEDDECLARTSLGIKLRLILWIQEISQQIEDRRHTKIQAERSEA